MSQHRYRDRARARSLAELRLGEKFLLTTHENPDGDALGSLVAMHEILKHARQGHRDVHVGGGVPAAVRVPPPPARATSSTSCRRTPSERTIVFLDCGNIDRMPVDFLQRDDAHIVNIDHHHDNTRFGTANLVVGSASCTAEIIYALTKDLGVELTPEIARRSTWRSSPTPAGSSTRTRRRRPIAWRPS